MSCNIASKQAIVLSALPTNELGEQKSAIPHGTAKRERAGTLGEASETTTCQRVSMALSSSRACPPP